jgi:hypothetical protein
MLGDSPVFSRATVHQALCPVVHASQHLHLPTVLRLPSSLHCPRPASPQQQPPHLSMVPHCLGIKLGPCAWRARPYGLWPQLWPSPCPFYHHLSPFPTPDTPCLCMCSSLPQGHISPHRLLPWTPGCPRQRSSPLTISPAGVSSWGLDFAPLSPQPSCLAVPWCPLVAT